MGSTWVGSRDWAGGRDLGLGRHRLEALTPSPTGASPTSPPRPKCSPSRAHGSPSPPLSAPPEDAAAQVKLQQSTTRLGNGGPAEGGEWVHRCLGARGWVVRPWTLGLRQVEGRAWAGELLGRWSQMRAGEGCRDLQKLMFREPGKGCPV